MKRYRLVTAIVVGGLTVAGRAHGQTVNISWDDCAPIVTEKSSPASGPVTFYASVVGQTLPHKGYQVWWLACDANGALPDAWRFDDAGCQAGFYAYSAQPPIALSKVCPGFVSVDTPQITIPKFQLSLPVLGLGTTAGVGCLAVSYPSGSTNTDPAQRYHLAAFLHDFYWAVNGASNPGVDCGGFESPVGIQLLPARETWVDMNNQESNWNVGNWILTVRQAGFGCLNVPARPARWGQIKAQYRN